MTCITIVCSLHEIRDQLIPVLQQKFLVSRAIAESTFDDGLAPHFIRFKNSVHIVIEHPYVDRVYRDSFYSYFSTKMGDYKKDCIRLSFFEGSVNGDDFRDKSKISATALRYLGFMVLRPTIPSVVGRSVISPAILRQNDFISVSSSFHATVRGVKFQVVGFPYSSQDAETISCAETSIWAIMEYFSSKYSDYRPALPSAIIKALQSRSNDRQIPSTGLNAEQVGFALREFGFGTKTYLRKQFHTPDFIRLISCYIESGLPLEILIDNFSKGGSIGHAVLAIGRTKTTSIQIDKLNVTNETDFSIAALIKAKSIYLYDNDDIARDIVFIDDNHPPYQLAPINNPARHYNNADWSLCEVSYFIVPLYPKIYLEAFVAKNYIKNLLLRENFIIPIHTEVFIRIFLTSGRSYKDYLASEESFDIDVKEFIMDTPMAKFIWICEVSNKPLMKQGKAIGLFILDATEPNLQNYNPLIFAGYLDRFYYPDPNTRELKEVLVNLGIFSIYTNNLKGF
jgi:hypothetical protein